MYVDLGAKQLLYHFHMKTHRKNPTACGTSPYQGEVGRDQNNVQSHKELVLAAEQGSKKIAVEIKSFVSPSEMADLKDAIGGFIMYRAVIHRLEPKRTLYLAVRDSVFTALFEEPIGTLLIETENLKLLVFNPETERIIQWIP